MRKIVSNKIRCKKCGDIISSPQVYFALKWCSCKSVAVDGGLDWLRRIGNSEDWEELSEYIESEQDVRKIRSENEDGWTCALVAVK